ncbi:MAG: guanylate kinase [Anaerocolumna sp.]
MSKIFIVMGKSATGKDTIFNELKIGLEGHAKTVIGYTTRPIRDGEMNGVAYHFVDQKQLSKYQEEGKIIERRSYDTVHGIWEYFTVDDGQINLLDTNYIMLGTLASFRQIRNYYGEDKVCPVYLEVEDGLRLFRALSRERGQIAPKYKELCRRYLADEEDFSEDNLRELNIVKRYNNLDMGECLMEILTDIRKML